MNLGLESRTDVRGSEGPIFSGIHRERTNLTFRFWALEGFETIDAAEAQARCDLVGPDHLVTQLSSCPKTTQQHGPVSP